jgi:hypothetical protein
MASRIIFKPTGIGSKELFSEVLVEFVWVPGMAISQGRQSVLNLHSSAESALGISKILEISTRSLDSFGVSLSAFNLEITFRGRKYPVEAVYQACKVFQSGGPYLDILSSTSIDAKRDSRLKESGPIIGFRFEGIDWPLMPSPNFYDYLYIRALLENENRHKLSEFNAFSDLAYNQTSLLSKPGKSFNCQARSAAIYVSLLARIDENSILDWLLKVGRIEKPPLGQLDLF